MAGRCEKCYSDTGNFLALTTSGKNFPKNTNSFHVNQRSCCRKIKMIIKANQEINSSRLESKLKDKTAVIGIVGLGYVGLPLAIAFAQAGLKTIGFDVQEKRVSAVNKNESYIADISNQTLSSVTINNYLRATIDQSQMASVDAVFVCVPTPLSKTKAPDLSYVIQESEEISRYIQHGQLVILESTTYPGTTKEVVLPILETSGLKIGQDFFLAYSPERVDPGNKNNGIKNTPKLVGGIDAESTRLATLLYSQVVDTVIPLSSAEVAEMAKVFENVFRNVNIALINEIALLCEKMDISVWEVIEAASSKPFGFMPFYPGPGVGGHCIPIDPYYLSSKARECDFHTRFIDLAAEINERMPNHVVYRVMEILNTMGKSINGAQLLVLGVAFKKDVADLRESPSLKLVSLLLQKGAKVTYNDPYVAQIQIGEDTLTSADLTQESLKAADCIIIATDHSSYDYQHIVNNARIVFDTRGVTWPVKDGNVFRLGE